MKLLVGVATLLIIAFAVFVFARPKATDGGFKQYVTDAEYRDSVNAQIQGRINAKAPASIDEKGIEALVEKLLDPKDPTFASEQLRSLNERAVPALVRALDDRRFFKESVGEFSLPSAPVTVVLSLLESYRPIAAIEPLKLMVKAEQEYLRKEAALTLGNIANDECIASLQTALGDPEDYVRSYAMMGIQRALKDKQGSPAFRKQMFLAVVPLLNREDQSLSEAANTLLLLDREQAVDAILDDRAFNLTNPIITRSLHALNEHEVIVPADKLHRLMKPFRQDLSKYPNDAIYGECLVALARTDDPTRDELIKEALKHSSKRIVESAAKAISVQKGVAGIMDKIWKRYSAENDLSRLTSVEQNIIGVRLLIDQVENGGFDQYFFNSSGDHLAEGLLGLKAIKAPETEALLEKAIKFFGSSGPNRNRDKRMTQMEKFSERTNEQIDALNNTFYEDNENREAKLLLYIAEQSEVLKGLPEPK